MVKLILGYPRKDVTFWILGDTGGANYNSKNIVCTGSLKEEGVRRTLGFASCMLYLPYFDWNPNAVVEALVAGVPVIGSRGCGVEELVLDSGALIDTHKPIKPKLHKNLKPPDVKNPEAVYAALDQFLNFKVTVRRPDLYIQNTAKQYKKVFDEALG